MTPEERTKFLRDGDIKHIEMLEQSSADRMDSARYYHGIGNISCAEHYLKKSEDLARRAVRCRQRMAKGKRALRWWEA